MASLMWPALVLLWIPLAWTNRPLGIDEANDPILVSGIFANLTNGDVWPVPLNPLLPLSYESDKFS